MTRSQRQYSDSYLYEAFMTRAYRASRDLKKGTDNGEFRVLEHIENGRCGTPADYPKQMKKLKMLIMKGVEKVLKWKLTIAERSQVIRFADMAEKAYDGDDLAVALRGLLDATHRLKEG